MADKNDTTDTTATPVTVENEAPATWWQRHRTALGVVGVLLAMLVVGGAALLSNDDSGNGGTSTAGVTQPPPAPKKTHVVRKGDYLVKIGQEIGVPWEAIFLENEAALAERAEERCSKLSDRYTNNSRRRGHYCNERLKLNGKPMVAPNSLQPGDTLVIPDVQNVPTAVSQAVAAVAGDEIVLVVDDTGSMSEDRQTVSAWYMAEVKNSGKRVTKVILYSDGYVRELDPSGTLELNTLGSIENTRHALETAAGYHPDAVVLVSDEPGDDWNGFRGLKLPPVVAHSLDQSADANLREVARLSGGTFVAGSAQSIAKR